MGLKKQKRPVTPPSDEEQADKEFLIDPDHIFDVLPQPFRLVDKILNYIFDKTWSIIEGIEDEKALKLSKECLPSYDCGRPLFDFTQPCCMCSDNIGKYLFVAHSSGLSVVEALIGQSVTTVEDPSAKDIKQMCACVLCEGFFVLCTLDNSGTGKLFSFFGDQLSLTKVFTDESTKQATATLVQLSDDGNYVGIGWEVKGKESWLEVYRIPKDAWIKEAEPVLQVPKARKLMEDLGHHDSSQKEQHKTSEGQENASLKSSSSPAASRPGSAQGTPSQSAFSKLTVILRVRPPPAVGPCVATNYIAALKAVDPENNVIGVGANHVLTSQYFQHSDVIFRRLHEQKMQYFKDDQLEPDISKPSFHFLKPGKFVHSGLDNAPNKVNSMCVWWRGGTQLFIYSLIKTAKDIEIKPEAVWPNAREICSSAISICMSVLAVGLKDGLVGVWDIHRGLLLRVCTVTNHAEITYMHFLPSSVTQPYSEEHPSYLSSPTPVVNLAVACSDGSFNMVQCGVAYTSPIKPLIDKSAAHEDVITSGCSLLKTPQVIAACRESGRITLFDSIAHTAMCHVALPQPYSIDLLSTPCIAADGQVMVVKGFFTDEDSGEEEEEEKSYTSTLFTFPLRSFPSLDRYWRMPVSNEPYGIDNTINTKMNSLIQDRISSQGTRQIRMQERWGKLKEELKKKQSNKKCINGTVWITKQQQQIQV